MMNRNDLILRTFIKFRVWDFIKSILKAQQELSLYFNDIDSLKTLK